MPAKKLHPCNPADRLSALGTIGPIDMPTESKRRMDWNGFMEVRDNPISKVGVFPYMGSEIPGAEDPDRIYYVYRPAEELSRKETIDSFKLMPFIDEHEVLGKSGMPAERKGMQGTLGEQIYFDAPYLRGNIKIHSSAAQSLIAAGKVELSPCYGCDWEKGDGSFEGAPYQYTQRNIMGNHLALVEEGRTGPDVAVQDHRKFTLDSAELLPMALAPEDMEAIKTMVLELLAAQNKPGDTDPEDKPVDEDPLAAKPADADPEPGETSPDETDYAEGDEVRAAEKIEEIVEEVKEAISEIEEATEDITKASDGKSRKAALDRLTVAKAKLGKAKAKQTKFSADARARTSTAKDGALARQVAVLQKELKAIKAKPAQDSVADTIAKVADRDALARQVTQHVGVFDASRMTADGVAKYAVGKLGIKCAAGNEALALDAWMQGRKPAHETIARDSAANSSESPLKLWGTK